MISILPPNATLQTLPVNQVPVPAGTVAFSDLLDGGKTQLIFVPGASFQIDADALGEKDSLARQQDQRCLFTFTELGMFGRYYAQFMPADKLDLDAGQQPGVTSAASMAPPGKFNDASLAEDKQALSIKDTSPLSRQSANEISIESHEPLLASVQRWVEWPAAGNSDAMSTEMEAVEEYRAVSEGVVPEAIPSSANTESFEVAANEEAPSPLEGGAPMHEPSIELKNQNPAPVNLAVLGSSEALVVFIRSPIEAGESIIRLRQAVESMAAEFGMDVAELRINGSSLGQISTSIKGGSNGGRAG